MTPGGTFCTYAPTHEWGWYMAIRGRSVWSWCLWLAVISGFAAPAISAADLSFDDRVRYQRAIEDVYWRHRLWPAENPGRKPALSEVMPDAAIRARVETYVQEAAALETIWRRPITHQQLQAEIDRMVQHTRDERMLTELFHALGDDPGVIAETLARQTLADRLIRDRYAFDTRFHGDLRRRAEAARTTVRHPEDLAALDGEYRKTTLSRDRSGALGLRWEDERERMARRFPENGFTAGGISPVEEMRDAFTITAVIADRGGAVEVATVTWPKIAFADWWARQRGSLSLEIGALPGPYAIASPLSADCVPDSWTPTYSGVPDGRARHTAVWTGTEMIVWGGETTGGATETGGRYSPATDTWTPTSTGPGVPAARLNHTAVWTGSFMVVWGGRPSSSSSVGLASGGRYDPFIDTWLPVSASGAPSARYSHTATWTGSLIVVWGGVNGGVTGGRYNASIDTWSATSIGAGVPVARSEHTAIWSLTEVIIWGGRDLGGTAINTGARYNPSSDTWTATSTTGGASARWSHAAIWTGSEMIVWGGRSNPTALNTGGRYRPSNDTWTTMSTGPGVPTARYDHAYTWTGGKLIVWGGLVGIGGAPTNTGSAYDSPNDTWTQTSVVPGVPTARQAATAIWTGSEMIIWGGLNPAPQSTGGRYSPASNSWVATSIGSYVPSARGDNTAVWTGTEMIVWGGVDATSYLSTGGRYNAATDVWTPTTTTGAPSGRELHTAVWTGTRMIVWGGYTGVAENTGARYDPSTDAWSAINTPAPANARYFHTALWTGSVMIVWGGQDNLSTPLASGVRYDPVTDIWSPTSVSNAPSARLGHTVVWTGTEMIVWGGGDSGSGANVFNTGGRYNPSTNTWTQTSTLGSVPSARFYHDAVWTGSEMIVWGGAGVVTGGRYAPATDTWTATPTGAGVPAPRSLASAVWTGSEMIVWGGYDAANNALATGGRYGPAAATWTGTSIGSNLPTARARSGSVWTGSAMIVWGGEPFTGTGARYCATTCASPNTYYLDADGDGYGAAGSSVVACSMPTGYSSIGSDCDDSNPNVNPGAFDPCDGTDRNCDGVGDSLLPGEINFGPTSRIVGAWRYSWPAVPGLRVDAMRGVYKGAAGTDPLDEYCLYNNSYATTWDDDNAPEPGKFWWFLIRGVNGCGNGTWGFQTVHATPTTERSPSPQCP